MRSKRFLITLLTGLAIIGGTLLAIELAKGYRPGGGSFLQGTGLLAANSFPNGAQVYLDGNLTTATDSTLNLQPGEYEIEIRKDGYTSWFKRMSIEKELVTQTNAMLFPSAPSLTPLTFTGALNITPSPDGQKIAFYVASASAQTKNGLYVLNMTNNVLSQQQSPRQIAQENSMFDYSETKLLWTPDSAQILASYEGRNVLLDPDRMNVVPELRDVTYQLPTLFSQWEEELYKTERTRLAKFPLEIQNIATASAKNIYFSPDDERVLYTATASGTLADNLIPQVPSSNTQPQERDLQPGGIYVYDRKEDRNFRVATEATSENDGQPYTMPKVLLANDLYNDRARTLAASPSAFNMLQTGSAAETIFNFQLHYSNVYSGNLQWYPDSKHLMGVRDTSVIIKEYDNTNETVIFAGSFEENFVYSWPNGSKLIILTNFQQGASAPTNLYAITLK